MKSSRIHVQSVSVRLRGATPAQARQRAGAIAQEIAQALAGQASASPRNREITKLSVRLPAAGKADVAAQIRSQWSGE